MKISNTVSGIEWYPWYVTRWRSSETRFRLTAAARGIYRELLDQCWIEGSLPCDLRSLQSICGATNKEFKSAWPQIEPCFKLIGDRLHQRTVDENRPGQVAKIAARREAGTRGGVNSGTSRNQEKLAKNEANAKQTRSKTEANAKQKRTELELDTTTTLRSVVVKHSAPPTPQPFPPPLEPHEPDPQQAVRNAIEEAAAVWPRIGDKRFAMASWEREAAKSTAGVVGWCRKIVSTAKLHATAHMVAKANDPRHFIPTLDRWVTSGDYTSPPPQSIAPKAQPTRGPVDLGDLNGSDYAN